MPLLRFCLLLVMALAVASASPLIRVARQAEQPMPYSLNWEVDDPETEVGGLFMNHQETAEESNPGRVDGSYQVRFEDGRLMTVTYFIEGDSGFNPTVTWS